MANIFFWWICWNIKNWHEKWMVQYFFPEFYAWQWGERGPHPMENLTLAIILTTWLYSQKNISQYTTIVSNPGVAPTHVQVNDSHEGVLEVPPPKIYHFQFFVDVKEVVFVGNLLQRQSKYTITFKKDEHILRSESTTFLVGNNLFQTAAFLSMLEKRRLHS